MTEPNASFAPDWASPPGDTIADLIEERGWTQAESRRTTGLQRQARSTGWSREK